MQKEATYKVLDYYPFGMQMPARSFSGASGYKFGFNGMLKDGKDWTGNNDSHLDFGARIYDSRLGRWLSTDPLEHKYPYSSTYNHALNSPLYFVDPDGNSVFVFYVTKEFSAGWAKGVAYLEISGKVTDDIGVTVFKAMSIESFRDPIEKGARPDFIMGLDVGYEMGFFYSRKLTKADQFFGKPSALEFSTGTPVDIQLSDFGGGLNGGISWGAILSTIQIDKLDRVSLTKAEYDKYTDSGSKHSQYDLSASPDYFFKMVEDKVVAVTKLQKTYNNHYNGFDYEPKDTDINVYSDTYTNSDGELVPVGNWETEEYQQAKNDN